MALSVKLVKKLRIVFVVEWGAGAFFLPCADVLWPSRRGWRPFIGAIAEENVIVLWRAMP